MHTNFSKCLCWMYNFNFQSFWIWKIRWWLPETQFQKFLPTSIQFTRLLIKRYLRQLFFRSILIGRAFGPAGDWLLSILESVKRLLARFEGIHCHAKSFKCTMSSWIRKMLSRNVTSNCWELNLEVELVSSSPSSRSSFSSGTNEVSAQAEKIPWKRRVKAMSSSVMQQEKPLQTRHQVSESEGEENENDKDDALLELEGHRRLQDARGLQDNIKGSVGPTIILKHRQRQLFSHRRKRRRLWPMLGVWLLLLAFEALSLTDAFVLEGSQTSYAQFRKWLPTTNSSIEFEFLTDQPNGILLYTDDGGYYDFIEVKLVEGSVRLRFNFDREPKVLTVGRNLNDGRTWHKVIIARNGLETALTVDQIRATAQLPKPKRPEDLNFGNITLNSYVYVGGLPSWYTTRLSNLALPSVVFEPRFQGAIRNLVYVDEGSEAKPRRQEVMAYRVRESTHFSPTFSPHHGTNCSFPKFLIACHFFVSRPSITMCRTLGRNRGRMYIGKRMCRSPWIGIRLFLFVVYQKYASDWPFFHSQGGNLRKRKAFPVMGNEKWMADKEWESLKSELGARGFLRRASRERDSDLVLQQWLLLKAWSGLFFLFFCVSNMSVPALRRQ